MRRTTLKGITWDHPRGLEPLVRCAEVYAAAFGVDVQWTARSLKDFGDAPIDGLAADYDLLIIDHPHVGHAHATRALAPLDELLTADQLHALRRESAGASHSSYDFAGHQWALAVDTAMQATSYRRDLLEQALPQTWTEALELAQRLRARQRWMAVPLAPTDAICLFISLCAGAGDQPGRRDDGRFVSPAIGDAALRLLRELAANVCPECLDWNPIEMLDALSMRHDLVYCPASFVYTNYARTGFRAHPLCFGNIPGIRGSCLGGAGIAVSAQCATPSAAADFAAWICGATVQTTHYVRAQGQPGNAAAWRDAGANAITGNFFSDTLATIEAAYVRPRHTAWPDFQEQAGIRLNRWLRSAPRGDPAALLGELEELHARTVSAQPETEAP